MCIYALVDPRDGLVRYVGKSRTPRQRYSQHLHGRVYWNGRKNGWIRDLYNEGLRPDFRILERLGDTRDEDAIEDAERRWIKHFVDLDNPLLNVKSGGSSSLNLQRADLDWKPPNPLM